MAGTHEVAARVLAGVHEVTRTLLAGARRAHRGELAEAQQPGQLEGVAAVGLDALVGRPGDAARNGDEAGDLAVSQARASPKAVGLAS